MKIANAEPPTVRTASNAYSAGDERAPCRTGSAVEQRCEWDDLQIVEDAEGWFLKKPKFASSPVRDEECWQR
jgi:hypothetical protein